MAGLPPPWYNRSPTALALFPITSPTLLERENHISCPEGPSDLPESERSNLTEFSLNFTTSPTPSLEASANQGLSSPLVNTRSGSERAKSESGDLRLKLSLLPFPRSRTSSYTPGILNPERKYVNFSQLSSATVSFTELQESNEPELGATPVESQVPSDKRSSASENVPPRSVRRVIRPDNWWQKNTKKKSLNRDQLDPSDPLNPAPLRIRTQSLAVKKSLEFLSKVQPLVSSSIIPLVPISEAKAEGSESRVLQSSEPQDLHAEGPNEDTPRITQENNLRHIFSEESFRDQAQVSISAHLAGRKEETHEGQPRMSMLHPDSAAAMTEHRREAVRLAKAQEKSVVEKCKRSDQAIPGYTFDELIGKGSYGRVYKG
jgi:hypothetical protein